jgi:hypothetical protein
VRSPQELKRQRTQEATVEVNYQNFLDVRTLLTEVPIADEIRRYNKRERESARECACEREPESDIGEGAEATAIVAATVVETTTEVDRESPLDSNIARSDRTCANVWWSQEKKKKKKKKKSGRSTANRTCSGVEHWIQNPPPNCKRVRKRRESRIKVKERERERLQVPRAFGNRATNGTSVIRATCSVSMQFLAEDNCLKRIAEAVSPHRPAGVERLEVLFRVDEKELILGRHVLCLDDILLRQQFPFPQEFHY